MSARLLEAVSTPSAAALPGSSAADEGAAREIDSHFHLVSLAADAGDLQDYLTRRLERQVAKGAEDCPELAARLLGPGLAPALEGLRRGLTPVSGTASVLSASVHRWLCSLSQGLVARQHALEAVAGSLRDSLASSHLEACRRADQALEAGLRSTGPERQDRLRQALALYHGLVSAPSLEAGHVLWFRIGWLLWKAAADLPAAEDAFSRAATLSAETLDVYYAESLRHLAYLRYLRGNVVSALETVREALSGRPDCDARFDAARYTAALGDGPGAASLLKECIDERPLMVVPLLAEADFASPEELREKLVSELCPTARRSLTLALQEWDAVIEAVREAARHAQYGFALPSRLLDAHEEVSASTEDASFLLSLVLVDHVKAQRTETLSVARTALARAAQEHHREAADTRKQLELLRRRAGTLVKEASEREREELEKIARDRRQTWVLESLGVGFIGSLLVAFAVSLVILGLGTQERPLSELLRDPGAMTLYGASVLCTLAGGPLSWLALRYNQREAQFQRRRRRVVEASAKAARESEHLIKERIPQLEKVIVDLDTRRGKLLEGLDRLPPPSAP